MYHRYHRYHRYDNIETVIAVVAAAIANLCMNLVSHAMIKVPIAVIDPVIQWHTNAGLLSASVSYEIWNYLV